MFWLFLTKVFNIVSWKHHTKYLLVLISTLDTYKSNELDTNVY